MAGPFLFNFAIDDIMRRTVDQCPADIVLAPSGCPLTGLEYADDVVIFAESSTKLQHVVNLGSKLAAAYGLRLRPDKCRQMWISLRPRTEIRATSAFNSLTNGQPHHQRSQAASLPIRNSSHHDVRIGDLGSTINGYGEDEDPYAELDVVYRRMTSGRYQHLAPPSKVAKVNRLRFFGHVLGRPADRLVQRVLGSLPGSSWKNPPGRKRNFWTKVVKEDLRTLLKSAPNTVVAAQRFRFPAFVLFESRDFLALKFERFVLVD
ncbi:hypothetical protein RB195_007372 [Necator americanus]|uniref:Reverse transcriptase domain-containing protein n=1 Tax=Necator americanus TaxID=51031 RepID=A0ABR1BX14_NECAM